MVLTGYAITVLTVGIYFFDIYYLLPEPWPIDAWWGIPAFVAYVIFATIGCTLGVRIMNAGMEQFWAKVLGVKRIEKVIVPNPQKR